jgi:hypothetical protein
MAISFLNESSFNSDVTFTGSTFGIHGTGSALSIGDPSSGLGRSSLFAFGTDTFHIQQDQAGGNIQIETDDFIVKNHGASETYIRAQDNNSVQLYYNGSEKLETKSDGIEVTGDVLDRDIPCLFNSNFFDGTSSSIFVVPFNNNTEATVSAKTYYHFATMPYAGQLKRVTFKNVSGTPSTSSFTVQLFLYVNGSQQTSSNEISWSNTNGITWSPTSSNTFSAGDEITIGYQKSTSSRTMAGVAAGVVVEFTDYDI